MGVINFLTTRIGKLVSALLAGAALIFGAIQFGKRQERETNRVDELEEYIETKEDIQDVEVSPDNDAAVERLRDNGWVRKRNM